MALNKKGVGLAALAGASILTSSALAQGADGWKVSGSLRVRYEAVAGQARPGFNADDELINLRTTLFAEHRSGPLRIGGEVYDSRAWGGDRATPISTSEVNTFEAVQAYVALDLKTETLGPVTVLAGRSMLNLGSRRLVAADDYRNTTNSYTGLRLDMAPAGLRTTLIYVQPQQRLPDGLDAVLDNRHRLDRESPSLELWGGVAAKPKALGPATLEGTYLHFEEHDAAGHPTRDRSLDTVGVRVLLDPKTAAFDCEIEAMHQSGEVSLTAAPRAPRQAVSADFVHADVGYTFSHRLRPRVSAEFDWVSGDRAGGKYNRFDTLFGMRRADFAPSGLYAALGRANMITPGVRLELAPSRAWDAFAAVRGLWLEARDDAFATTGVRDASGRSGRYAGTQIEARWRYWLIKDRLRAEADGVWLAKGHFLKRAPNAPKTGDARYLSLNLTAQF
jgi:hypothetical protein